MAHDESAGGMELVKNEELAARQLHNQWMISRMIMRNEWRTNRLPSRFELVRGCTILFRPLLVEREEK